MADIDITVGKMSLKDLLKETEEVVPKPDPVLLVAQIKAVVADLVEIELHNGYHGIAAAHGIPVRVVRHIERARQSRIGELVNVEEATPLEGEPHAI